MRFKVKPSSKFGDKRTKIRFLFLPKEIGAEIRWLEMAAWEETYTSSPLHDVGGARTKWISTKWINGKEKNNVGQSE